MPYRQAEPMLGKTQGSLALLLQERARIDAELRRHRSDVAILFSDVVGSTSYYERYGNTAGIMLVQQLDHVTSQALKKFNGRLIKSTGDGSMAEFSDSVKAVQAAIAMQQQLLKNNENLSEPERIQLRIGINWGEVFRKAGDVWGNAVNVAARVCAQCEPAQILISSAVHSHVGQEAGLHFSLLGRFALKGIQQQEELFEVVWTEGQAYKSLRKNVTQLVATGLLVKRDLATGPEMPVVGAVFASRYQILQELGVGGMGVVYKAMDQETGETLALKVLRADIASDAVSAERFKNELRVARKITHPKVCRVHDFGRASGTAFISMEFVEGYSLNDLIGQHVMSIEDALQVGVELCDGLAEVHRQGAVHRDLKPNNIMLTTSQEVKLMDFGIARLGNAGLTQTGVALGTPQYMAPEQVAAKPLDARTDVYAVGLVLYEMLVQRPAFEDDTPLAVAMKQLHENPPPPRQLQPAIPAEVEQIILKCLQKEPNRRYNSALEVRDALLQVLGQSSTSVIVGPRRVEKVAEGQASSEAATGKTWTSPRDGQVYVWVPPGEFNRGAWATDHEAAPSELPMHSVTLTHGFWIGQTPVTVAAYQKFAKETGAPMPPVRWKPQCPITDVSWHDAQAYCFWVHGRLPTDAEWAYAARAGYNGPRYGEAQKIAWFRVTPPGPRPVRGKQANAWGLYDVLGNVWEWCADWFEEYTADAVTDPKGPDHGDYKIIRGGSWDDHVSLARLSARSWRLPDFRSPSCGFRVVIDSQSAVAPTAPVEMEQASPPSATTPLKRNEGDPGDVA